MRSRLARQGQGGFYERSQGTRPRWLPTARPTQNDCMSRFAPFDARSSQDAAQCALGAVSSRGRSWRTRVPPRALAGKASHPTSGLPGVRRYSARTEDQAFAHRGDLYHRWSTGPEPKQWAMDARCHIHVLNTLKPHGSSCKSNSASPASEVRPLAPIPRFLPEVVKSTGGPEPYQNKSFLVINRRRTRTTLALRRPLSSARNNRHDISNPNPTLLQSARSRL